MNSVEIGNAMVRQVFQAKALMIVPECYWAGDEADLLVITKNLRVIDVEIKTSRADFRRDANKSKWWHTWDYRIDGPYSNDGPNKRRAREWPRRVWKHYFAMPEAIWKPEMAQQIPSPASGVLLLRERHGSYFWRCEHRAKPNPKAAQIDAEDAIDIARLAGLRMWAALKDLQARGRECDQLRDRLKALEHA